MSIADHLNEIARFQARIDEMTASTRAWEAASRVDRELLEASRRAQAFAEQTSYAQGIADRAQRDLEERNRMLEAAKPIGFPDPPATLELARRVEEAAEFGRMAGEASR